MIPELSNIKTENALKNALKGDYDELAVKFLINVLRQKPLQARMPLIEVKMDR